MGNTGVAREPFWAYKWGMLISGKDTSNPSVTMTALGVFRAIHMGAAGRAIGRHPGPVWIRGPSGGERVSQTGVGGWLAEPWIETQCGFRAAQSGTCKLARRKRWSVLNYSYGLKLRSLASLGSGSIRLPIRGAWEPLAFVE